MDGVQPGWERTRPASALAVGEDDVPWGWWLPLAWRHVADPTGTWPVPDLPEPLGRGERDESGLWDFDEQGELIAFFGPLLPLLRYGLGWLRPDLGLAAWQAMGRPTEDPVLATVQRWWGPWLGDVHAWLAASPLLTHLAEPAEPVLEGGGDARLVELRRRGAQELRVLATAAGGAVFSGGYDPLHLVDHAKVAVDEVTEPLQVFAAAPAQGSGRRLVLMCEGYRGWYRALDGAPGAAGLEPVHEGRSVRVDVVVAPLGWLGQYRRSRVSGQWFSGQHRWHALGC